MKTEIRYVEALKNDSLEEQLNDKLQGLERKYDWIIDAQVFFKTEKHPNEENFVCEIKLAVPGQTIFSSSNEINFNKAINSTIQQLGGQLERMKAKMIEH
jgi:putative sigma-54 modulation protein